MLKQSPEDSFGLCYFMRNGLITLRFSDCNQLDSRQSKGVYTDLFCIVIQIPYLYILSIAILIKNSYY